MASVAPPVVRQMTLTFAAQTDPNRKRPDLRASPKKLSGRQKNLDGHCMGPVTSPSMRGAAKNLSNFLKSSEDRPAALSIWKTKARTIERDKVRDNLMAGFISEFRYIGGTSVEFIEIAVLAGTDVSGYSVVIYNSDGTVAHTYSLTTVQSTSGGNDVYVLDSGTAGYADILNGQAIALIDDTGTVDQFVSFGGSTVTATSGPAAGETSTNVGSVGFGQSLQSDDGGASYYTQTAPNKGTVPCYAPGTMIDTPDGPRAVETLRPGDLVLTLDHGPQPIRWLRSGDHPLVEVEVDGKPVLIAAGALGDDLPAQDLIVSPQHRILVGGGGQLTDYFDAEVLAPAKALTSLPGIRHMKGKSKITYIHFACDRHEVVTANGCLSEALLLGPMVVSAVTTRERQTLARIFGTAVLPEMALNGPPSRECLAVGTVQRYLIRRSKVHKEPYPKEKIAIGALAQRSRAPSRVSAS